MAHKSWKHQEPTITEVFHRNYLRNKKNKYKRTKTIKFQSVLSPYRKMWNLYQWKGMLWNVTEDNEYNWEGLEHNGLQRDNTILNVIGGNESYLIERNWIYHNINDLLWIVTEDDESYCANF